MLPNRPRRTLRQRAWNTVRSPMQSQRTKYEELFKSVENGEYNRVLKYLNRDTNVNDNIFYGGTYGEEYANIGGIIGRVWFHPRADRTKEEVINDLQIFKVLANKSGISKYIDISHTLEYIFNYAEGVELLVGWDGERGGGAVMAAEATRTAAAAAELQGGNEEEWTWAKDYLEEIGDWGYRSEGGILKSDASRVARGEEVEVEMILADTARYIAEISLRQRQFQAQMKAVAQQRAQERAAQEDPQPVDANSLALVPILQTAQMIPQIDLPNTDAKINAIDFDDIEDGEEIVDIFTNNHHFYFRLTSINKWLTVQPGNNYTLPQGKILLGTKGNPNPAAGVVITRGLARVAVDGGYKRKRKSRRSIKTKRSKGSRSLGK